MKKYWTILPLVFCTIGYAQLGGKHAYEFLNLTSSPRVAALGGKFLTSYDDDLSLVYHNPSLLNSAMNEHLSFNYVGYFAGVKYGNVTYARKFREKNTIAIGVQYINYGEFTAAEPNGVITGSFTAAEYAFNLVYAHPIDSFFSIGADLRPILSIYEKYQSFGVSTDWGITYHHPHKLYTIALVMRNLGTQIKPYYDYTYERLPFEIQVGFTQQLKYAPFRFSITAQHLETPDMSIPDFGAKESSSNALSQAKEKRKIEKIADITMRHLIFGVEFVPFKNFYLRAGYNYQRRQELKIATRVSGVGFSWGFGISISRFKISYGRATYHLAGASNHFSVATDLSSFYRKK